MDDQGIAPGSSAQDSGAVSLPRMAQAQALAVDLLNALLAAPDAELDQQIDQALERLGRFSGCDRTYVFQKRDDIYMQNTHEWCREGIASLISGLQAQPIAEVDPWWHAFRSIGHVSIPDVAALPEGDEIREFLELEGVRSLLAVPLVQKQNVVGFVGYDAVHQLRVFPDAEITLIKSVANGIATVLHRRETTAAVNRAKEAFAAERSKLQAMMTALPDLVMEADSTGMFIGYHQTARMTMAVAPVEVVGKMPEQVLPPHLAALARRMMHACDRNGHAGPEDYALDMPDGRHWFSAIVASRMPATPAAAPGYVFVIRDITREIDQRRRIEQLDALARGTNSMLMITDDMRQVTWMNAACETRTGFTLDEARGMLPQQVIRPATGCAAEFDDLCARLDAGETVRAELKAQDRFGRDYGVALHARPIISEIDGTRNCMIVLNDITERQHHAAALDAAASAARAERLRLETAVDMLPEAFAYFDRDRRLVLCNAPYRALYPRTAPHIVPGAHLGTLVQTALHHGELSEPGREGEPHPILARFGQAHFENELRLPDGRWIRLIERATPDGGRVSLMIDITVLKNAEARARHDRETAFDALPEGIAIARPDGVLSYANPALIAMFAISNPDGVVGRPWNCLYPPDVAAALWERAGAQLRAEGCWQGEASIPAQLGEADTETVHALSITRNSDGSLLFILRDVSRQRQEQKEQLRLREELQLAQRREIIAQLASELTHDFSNLLGAIGGAAAVIRRIDTGSDAGALARRIVTATDQAVGLVRRLMSLSVRRRKRVTLDLREPLRDAAQLLRATLSDENTLRLALPETPVPVYADPTDILQVVLNLTINARDAVLGGKHAAVRAPQISVTLRPATREDLEKGFLHARPVPGRSYMALVVADRGPGMDPATIARAFDRHFTTKGAQGTGLGLPIVANVVAANAGMIALDSTPGAGCAVTVLWPTWDAVATDPSGAAVTAGSVRDRVQPSGADPLLSGAVETLAGRSVLIVDDNDDMLSALCRMVEMYGAEAAGCICAGDALEAIREAPDDWDLVLTDQNMPVMRGSELAAALKRIRPELPVILITGLATTDPELEGLALDSFAAILRKPIEQEELVTAMAATLEQRPTRESRDAHPACR